MSLIDKTTAGILYGNSYKLVGAANEVMRIVGVTDDHIICEISISNKT